MPKRLSMPRLSLVMAALATSLVASLPSASHAADPPATSSIPLRGDPDRLCRASAVVGRRGDTAWVVDAGVDDRLFGFALDAGRLTAARARNVDLSSIPAAERPRDVEAATAVVHSLLLVGSHARGAGCEIRPDRERVLLAAIDEDGTARTERALDDAPLMTSLRRGDEQRCLEDLFNPVGRANEASRRLCGALVAAERAASKDACETLAFAGSMTVLMDARERVWLALRAPLVDGKAVLVRLASLGALRFDMTALVDLGGGSIRELVAYRRSSLAIVGPAGDPRAPLALYELTPRADETFDARHVRDDLAPQSHALLATDDGLLVLVDGEAGDDGGPCRVPARQHLLKNPGGAP